MDSGFISCIRSLNRKINNFGRSMENIFIKDSPKFDGVNYDSWKEKMKTLLLYMVPDYWLLMNVVEMIMKEEKLEECSEAKRDYLCVI